MAAAVIWSQQALDDVDAIAEYIARDSPHHAQRVVEALFDLSDELVALPRAGRVVPELADENIRERFLYSYRLVYEIGERRIAIVPGIHGARLLDSIAHRFDPGQR